MNNTENLNFIKLCCDAQTSGGLLVSVPKDEQVDIELVKETMGVELWEIGQINSEYIEKINIIY